MSREDPRRARRQQDHHADQHVRPPDHPGRPVRRVPEGDARAAPGRARLLRRDLHLAADPVRAGALGPRRRRRLRGPDQQDRPGARADPRVPGARSPDGRHRPAGVHHPQAPRPGRAPARADALGPRPRVPGQRLRRPAADEAARHPRRAARLLLPPRRRRVHAHPGPGGAPLDPGADRAAPRQADAGRAEAHPQPAQRRRGVRDLPADQVRRPEALLAGGRRVADPAARRGAGGLRRGRGSTRSSSAWPTAAGSTCSPTSSASRTRRSSRSSRGTWTRARRRAPAT